MQTISSIEDQNICIWLSANSREYQTVSDFKHHLNFSQFIAEKCNVLQDMKQNYHAICTTDFFVAHRSIFSFFVLNYY